MVLKLRDELGNVYDVPFVRGVSIENVAVVFEHDDYRLKVHLSDGRDIDAGALPAAVPAGSHTHGNLTYDGKVGTESGMLVETGTDGTVEAKRRIVAGTTPPEEVTGLHAGDIYLYYEV